MTENTHYLVGVYGQEPRWVDHSQLKTYRQKQIIAKAFFPPRYTPRKDLPLKLVINTEAAIPIERATKADQKLLQVFLYVYRALREENAKTGLFINSETVLSALMNLVRQVEIVTEESFNLDPIDPGEADVGIVNPNPFQL